MPELPEVETVRIGLKRLIVGKAVEDVQFDWPKSFPNSENDIQNHLLGARVSNVWRRAKLLMIDLGSGYTLMTHLKMTGQLVYRGQQSFGAGHPTDSLVGDLPDRSTRVTLRFEDGSQLFFNDQRKFGWMKLLPKQAVGETDFFKKLGPEPLAEQFSVKDFILRFRSRNKTAIKVALMDQSVIAGVGNIYADEALFAARIHPQTTVVKVSDQKLEKLYQTVREVLEVSIQAGGSTDRNYVDAEGRRGSYLTFAQVFRREGEPCPRCSRPLKKIKVAGRGTHYCSNCQRKRR